MLRLAVTLAALTERIPAADLGAHLDTFEAFIAFYGRDYQPDTEEFAMRRSLYEKRRLKVEEHNSKPGLLWKEALNQFSDQTDKQRRRLLGRGVLTANPDSVPDIGGATLLSESTRWTDLPLTVDWRNLTVSTRLPDQGGCGSCWAVTTAMVMDAHMEIHRGGARHLSAQQLVSCLPNPRECGGKGGCDGATSQLAFKYIIEHGLVSESQMPYLAKDNSDEPCPTHAAFTDIGTRIGNDRAIGTTSLGITRVQLLTRNQDAPLARAVVELGPVAVSVHGDSWLEYFGGIYHGCSRDAVVDHAVALYGYGEESGTKYWLLKNTWGNWGENGFIRLQRHTSPKELQETCGTDDDPAAGSGCKGGPSSVKVCGMCGVLYESVVPHFENVGMNGNILAAIGPDARTLMRREAPGTRDVVEAHRVVAPSRMAVDAAVSFAAIGPDARTQVMRREATGSTETMEESPAAARAHRHRRRLGQVLSSATASPKAERR